MIGQRDSVPPDAALSISSDLAFTLGTQCLPSRFALVDKAERDISRLFEAAQGRQNGGVIVREILQPLPVPKDQSWPFARRGRVKEMVQ